MKVDYCLPYVLLVECIADDNLSFRNSCLASITTCTENALVKRWATNQGCQTSILAQTSFAAFFCKGLQLISGSPYAETEQTSQLASFSGLFTTPAHDYTRR